MQTKFRGFCLLRSSSQLGDLPWFWVLQDVDVKSSGHQSVGCQISNRIEHIIENYNMFHQHVFFGKRKNWCLFPSAPIKIPQISLEIARSPKKKGWFPFKPMPAPWSSLLITQDVHGCSWLNSHWPNGPTHQPSRAINKPLGLIRFTTLQPSM